MLATQGAGDWSLGAISVEGAQLFLFTAHLSHPRLSVYVFRSIQIFRSQTHFISDKIVKKTQEFIWATAPIQTRAPPQCSQTFQFLRGFVSCEHEWHWRGHGRHYIGLLISKRKPDTVNHINLTTAKDCQGLEESHASTRPFSICTRDLVLTMNFDVSECHKQVKFFSIIQPLLTELAHEILN